MLADSLNRMPLLPRIPTRQPAISAQPQISVEPYCGLNSRNRLPSTTLAMTSQQSKGCLTSAEASASVALNTIAGMVTHLLLMAGFFAWAGGADVGGISLPSVGTLLLVAVIAVAAIAIASMFRTVRRTVIRPIIDGIRTAAGYVAQVIRSPLRVAALLGGSTLITMSYLFALVFSVEAFGGGLTEEQRRAVEMGAKMLREDAAGSSGGSGPIRAAASV